MVNKAKKRREQEGSVLGLCVPLFDSMCASVFVFPLLCARLPCFIFIRDDVRASVHLHLVGSYPKASVASPQNFRERETESREATGRLRGAP